MNHKPVIRPLQQPELEILFQWVLDEGWGMGDYDLGIYYQINPEGILGLFLGDELIGTSAIFIHNPWFAFFGLYIVKPEYRGQGFGIQMTRHRLHLAGSRNIGLDGVADKISTYRKVGFRPAHRNLKFAFSAAAMPEPGGTINGQNLSFKKILQLDQCVFPGTRGHFLKHWLGHPAFNTRAVITAGELQGFITLRPRGDAFRTGPFVASKPGIARQLLQWALSRHPGKKLYIDIPECNPDSQQLVNQFKGELVLESTRMYRGYQPELDHRKLYGLTTLEAG